MTTVITPEHLSAALPGYSTEALQDAIDDAWALALVKAPCIGSDETLADETKVALIRAIVKRAIIHDITSRSATISSESAGPYSRTFNHRVTSPVLFSESQVQELRNICGTKTTQVSASPVSIPVASTMGQGGHLDRIRLERALRYPSFANRSI